MTWTPPAGWHPDPSNPAMLRWWDGKGWTEHTQPAPQTTPAATTPEATSQQPASQQPAGQQPAAPPWQQSPQQQQQWPPQQQQQWPPQQQQQQQWPPQQQQQQQWPPQQPWQDSPGQPPQGQPPYGFGSNTPGVHGQGPYSPNAKKPYNPGRFGIRKRFWAAKYRNSLSFSAMGFALGYLAIELVLHFFLLGIFPIFMAVGALRRREPLAPVAIGVAVLPLLLVFIRI